ncbi:MAG: rhomboid family intramembrane serine protease [Bacteroidales bacterium]|nr:rhomboid family intramembrane serine protease [Bacteroidales bacterium]
MNLTEEIKQSFKRGSTLTKLIYINLGVFVVVGLMFVFYFLFIPNQPGTNKQAEYLGKFLTYLMLQSDGWTLLTRPWTVFTYMFLHFDFLHILGNILWLFWFGRIFIKYLSQKQLLTTYLLGGLSGAALFVISYNVFPGLADQLGSSQALGASAAVMAIVISISAYAPNHEVYLPFLGPVKIKYITLIYFTYDILQIASVNSGGHIAHLGGAIYGYIFALQLKSGKDIGKGFSKIADSISVFFTRKSKLKVSYKNDARQMTDMDYNKSKVDMEKEVDRILEKIKKSGYDSLSKKEKETLFKMGK